jgi:EAL domain-containing protein (putative c-di-GMP-specific phosphodiesterase class I)
VAMYQAKQDRSGMALYEAHRDGTSVRLLTLNGELRKAIEDDRLSLSYQPKICAKTGKVLGVEALVRWTHPEQGNIPPDDFIGMAEQSGLIRPLTQWVLKTALMQGALWHSSGLRIGVSINISARNLLEEELPEVLAGMLRDSGMPADHVTLEVTESVIMTDPEAALEVITELSDLGVSISIDDFGTGYSSLGYLKKLPAREIKIDRSFVKDMDHEKDDAAIVASTIELAHNLGLSVVAEGVETEEIWQLLRKLGCDVAQGYLFSAPQPPDKITTWIRERMLQPELVGADAD